MNNQAVNRIQCVLRLVDQADKTRFLFVSNPLTIFSFDSVVYYSLG